MPRASLARGSGSDVKSHKTQMPGETEATIFHLKIQTLKITMPFSSLHPAFPIWGRTETCQGQRRTLYLFSRRFWSHRAEPPGLYHSFGQPILLVSLVQRD